jgi:polysaccharide deacetylase 2 family uncharacterized protein YibQ
LEGFESKPDIEAIRLRRRRRTLWRRIRSLGVLLLTISLVAAFLFSPWGPWSGVFFSAHEKSENADVQQPEGQAPGEATEAAQTDFTQTENDTASGGGRASDPIPPTIAIVVDDVGLDAANLEKWLMVDAPITFSALPYCAAVPELAESLYGAGFRIMLHIPTENEPPRSFSANGQIAVGMSRETVFSTLDGDLATVPHVTGINNHQGGRGCNDLQLMTYECEWARERGLFVMDSDSSTHSQVTTAAQSLGFPRRESQVFIDHHNEPESIRSQMHRLAAIARQEGTAIGICHFHRPNTPSVIGEMIRTLRAEGIHFAFVEDIHN